jgi:transcription initiation factor TFIIIB Brf1 subunit/transcription initiation factor TFIIB
MTCPRCESKTETVSEYFSSSCFVRDILCTKCNSVTVEKFFSDNSYRSEWIDLNV